MNPNGFRYGQYRVWGDLDRSRYFSTEHQSDITSLIRSLSPKASGDVLGRALQGRAAVRRLNEHDHQILSEWAAGFPLEYRAQLLPEERLESLLIAGNEGAVEQLFREQPSKVAEERQEYLVSRAQHPRDRGLVNQLRTLYEGRCQICSWSPRSNYGVDLCEAHHVRWLSRGGDDALENMVLICPTTTEPSTSATPSTTGNSARLSTPKAKST